MTYYLDSSAIAKIYIEEQGSEWVRRLRSRSSRGEVFLCELSGAEVFAALHRRRRAGNLSEEDLQSACNFFRRDFERFFTRLPVRKATVDRGMHLIQKYPLRGYDSIQLATAISFLNGLKSLNGEFLNFVSSDKVLNDAAQSEGLMVINPAELP